MEAGPSAIGGYSDNDDENAQQEVFGLGMSDEDSDAADYDDEEYREILRKTPGLRQHLGGLEDEEKEDVREDEGGSGVVLHASDLSSFTDLHALT